MSERKWHSGPPPHVGWWNASSRKLNNIWRWWDGVTWSYPAADYETAKEVSEFAGCADRYEGIKWTTYWPKNARVPRIKP